MSTYVTYNYTTNSAGCYREGGNISASDGYWYYGPLWNYVIHVSVEPDLLEPPKPEPSPHAFLCEE